MVFLITYLLTIELKVEFIALPHHYTVTHARLTLQKYTKIQPDLSQIFYKI